MSFVTTHPLSIPLSMSYSLPIMILAVLSARLELLVATMMDPALVIS